MVHNIPHLLDLLRDRYFAAIVFPRLVVPDDDAATVAFRQVLRLTMDARLALAPFQSRIVFELPRLPE
jgi:hypothetical protein